MAHGLTQARARLHFPVVGVFALFLCLGALPQRALANASIFVNTGVTACQYGFCKSASMFDLLVGSGDSLKLNGNTINDAIGLKSGATITTTGTDTIQGPIDFSDTFTPTTGSCTGTGCSHPSGSTFSSGTKVTGGTAYNPTLVSDAYTQFVAIDSYWKSQTSIALPSQASSGAWNIEKSSTGIHVYNATSLTVTGNVTIGCGTVNTNNTNAACNSSDLIVILISGAVNITNFNYTFAPASGLTDDQLLFIVESSSSTALTLNSGAAAGNNKTIRGDFFLDNGGGYTVGQATKTTTIDGRIFASNGSATLTWNANASEAAEPEVPEPGTWALMIGGIAALVWFRRRVPSRKNPRLP